MRKKVFKKPGGALEIGAQVCTAFATRSPGAALSSLTEVINFHRSGKRYLRNFLDSCFCLVESVEHSVDMFSGLENDYTY